MRHWTVLADQWDTLTEDKQSAIIGYEIACRFIPPHDVLKRSHLLSKMLAMCVDAGNVQSFQKKAAELFTIARQMKVCESQASITLILIARINVNSEKKSESQMGFEPRQLMNPAWV